MVATNSTMLPLGTPAPAFELADPNGKNYSLDALAADAKAVLVAFICNHCPYVKHIRSVLATRAAEWQQRGVAVVGINSNDAESYPDDSPEAMLREVAEHGYTFPYLVDDEQDVAKAYKAVCTPDLYLFDSERKLAYRGQFDSSRPNSDAPVTGDDLGAAIDAVLAGDPAPTEQHPSVGCSIKWKPGNEPT